MTDIYLAYSGAGRRALSAHNWEAGPINLLVSFPFLKGWEKWEADNPGTMRPTRMMLDSGAFSAYNKGEVIDIDALIAECVNPRWHEAVGLDVIGSWEGSRDNLDYMARHGCKKAMPVFHIGDPWELLEYYREHWPKVGLSCRFGESMPKSMKFYEQCFAKAWPHRFHSFGWTGEQMLIQFPFQSADSSTWMLRPGRFNVLQQYGKSMQFPKVSRPAMTKAVVGEIQFYVKMQRRLKAKWSRVLAQLEEP